MIPYGICNSEMIIGVKWITCLSMCDNSVPSHEIVHRPTTSNFEDVCPIACSQTSLIYFLTHSESILPFYDTIPKWH